MKEHSSTSAFPNDMHFRWAPDELFPVQYLAESTFLPILVFSPLQPSLLLLLGKR